MARAETIFTLLGVATLASCVAVLGIEENPNIIETNVGGNVGGNTGGNNQGGAPEVTDCASYCEVINRNCSGEFLQYTGDDVCMGVCDAFPLGDFDDEDPIGNTIACRGVNASQAAAEQLGPTTECHGAGPSSDGQCSTHCQSYCILLESLCTESGIFQMVYQNQTNCLNDCMNNVPVLDEFFSSSIHTAGDHIQCRTYHVTQAVLDDTTHCPHAAGLAQPCLAMGTGGGGGAGGAGGMGGMGGLGPGGAGGN